MMLKKYDELTEKEQKLVSIMYSDQNTVQNYLYNFEGEKYIGRQFYIPPEKTKEGLIVGTVHAEPLVKEEIKLQDSQVDFDNELKKEEVKEPVKKVAKRKSAKK